MSVEKAIVYGRDTIGVSYRMSNHQFSAYQKTRDFGGNNNPQPLLNPGMQGYLWSFILADVFYLVWFNIHFVISSNAVGEKVCSMVEYSDGKPVLHS